MKRYYLLLLAIIAQFCTIIEARIILPYSDSDYYQYGESKIWLSTDIQIHGGDYINSGIYITIDFTTPTSALNRQIISVGKSIGNNYEEAFSIHESGSAIALNRAVMIDGVRKIHTVQSWNKSLLQRNTNYTLKFEMDETRCRYSIWETGKESNTKYEYEFYGLADSYMKEVLDYTKGSFSVAITPHYKVQRAAIGTLGTGVGVKLPELKGDNSLIRIKNANSSKYMIPYLGSTVDNTQIVQFGSSLGGGPVWEFLPVYQQSRSPFDYITRLKNLCSNGYLSILNCALYNYTPVVSSNSFTCNEWRVNNLFTEPGYAKLINLNENVYAVVKDASQDDNAPVIIWDTGTTNNASWEFEQAAFHSSIDEGFYTIKNKYSNLYMAPWFFSLDESNVCQYQLTKNLNNVWYIKKDEFGLFTIQNIDSKKNLNVANSSTSEDAEILQSNPSGLGSEKWVIQEKSNTLYYTIRNLNSDKLAVVQGASKDVGAKIIQYSTGGGNEQWALTPYSFTTPRSVGGIFKLKNVYSNMYLVVEGASTSDNARLISWTTGDSPNSWWTFVELEDGGYAIKNVHSQSYIVIKDASLADNAAAIQFNREGNNNLGNSIWALEHDDELPSQDVYWLRNVHSGKILTFQSPEQKNGIPAIQVSSTESVEDRVHRWYLLPIY